MSFVHDVYGAFTNLRGGIKVVFRLSDVRHGTEAIVRQASKI